MRKPIIIGNWKMNMSIADGLNFLSEIEKVESNVEFGIAPQFVSLMAMKNAASKTMIGAQNTCDHTSGAFTGEVSVELLKELAIDFCVIGHSERRQFFNETDEAVNTKAKLLLENSILPVICVGETLSEFEAGKTKEVIEKQVEISCADLDIEKCVIAYEPVWAIGTGKTATAQIAQDVCEIVRNKVAAMYTQEAAEKVRIQYGGSVNGDNIKTLLECKDIDGALVGGASLKVDSFTSLIEG